MSLSKQQIELLDESVHSIGLSVRAANALEEQRNVITVRQLLSLTPDSLRTVESFGNKTVEDIYLCLERFGFYRKGRKPKRKRNMKSNDKKTPEKPSKAEVLKNENVKRKTTKKRRK